jgi:hypothetical protein
VGEDFLRKKTDQFQRLRGVQFTKLVERHLFSGIRATEVTETTGSLSSQNAPAPGTKLWPRVEDDGSVSFFAGNDRCVTVPGVRAQDLRPLVETGTSIGEVVTVDASLGHVRVRLTPTEINGDPR